MISLLFLFHLAVAEPPVSVWTRYPAAVGKVLPKESYHVLDSRDEEKEWREQGYLPPQKRDALFHKLKLEAALAQVDEMDKDLLVARARFEPFHQVRKYYPMLSEAQLKSLFAEVKEMARK